jgi:cell wall-associated NlpC family hydrolase
MNDKRRWIVNLAYKLQGIPYIWGGSNPHNGFDCSGFAIWIYQVFEALPSGDWTADGLSRMLAQTIEPEAGDLAFYGKRHSTGYAVTHVMMHTDRETVIGASGGSSDTTSEAEAIKKGARVKVKRLHYRSDYLFSCTLGS